ncbi:hypothetical protein TrCOL_g946 [Triparma columacea]|uniref:Uncharacterized protein n=1 Tax=Triparma columacea TaxID=722753 RepID=A0A9W7GAW8_9STRA|nr:hypothetical protein TrCOL_g946 [Triparma columacea]
MKASLESKIVSLLSDIPANESEADLDETLTMLSLPFIFSTYNLSSTLASIISSSTSDVKQIRELDKELRNVNEEVELLSQISLLRKCIPNYLRPPLL